MRHNRNWKKTGSAILAVCLITVLLLSNQSFGVFAEEEQSQAVTQERVQSEAVTEETSQDVDDFVSSDEMDNDGEDSSDETKNDDADIEATPEDGFYSEENSETDVVLEQEEESEAETDEEPIEVQADDTKISELINADVALVKWKSDGGTATVTLDDNVYNITDEQSYQETYEIVYKQMLDNTTSITDDLSTQTITKDIIWNISNTISMSGNITVESGARLIIIGTGTIKKNGNYGIIVKGETYLQGQVYFNGNQLNNALIQIQSGKVYLTDNFRLGNNNGNGITANSGKIYMLGGLIGTKDIKFEWYDGDNTQIGQKNYEETLSYINENLSSDGYNYINQITQNGGNTKGIQLQESAELYMNGGSIAGNGGITGTTGSGISADPQSKIVMTEGNIIGNQAGNSGGGLNIGCIATISGGLIAGNHSAGYAGGINMSGSTTLTGNAIIAFNSCAYNGGGMLIAQNATCTMTGDASVVHNRAVGANNTPNSGKGGAFRVVGNLIINNGKINYNSGNGPLDSKTIEQDIGGAISAQTDVLSAGEIRVATITLNGGEIAYNKANGRGGAIWMVCAASKYTATFELNGTNIHHNTAASNGGAIFLDARNGTLNANIKSGRLADNSATDKGGGVYLLLTSGATALTVNIGEKDSKSTSLEIEGNKSESIGGGLYIARTENSTGTSNVNLYSGTLNGNQAQNGGAIGVSQGNLNVYGGKFENNTAGINGGGAYVENGEVTVVNGNFQSNTAQNGGGAYIASGKLNVSEGSFYGNHAILNGGGAYVADGQVRMFGGSLKANTAKKDGGGLYVSSIDKAADVVIRSGSITDNTSGGSGAGLAVVGDENAKADTVILGLLEQHKDLKITDKSRSFIPFDYTDAIDNTSHNHTSCPVLQGNIADGDGGGIYMQSSSAILNIYCLKESENTSKTNINGNGVMMAGGKIVIGDEQYNSENAWGNTDISSPMLVEGGTVDIWGNMDNPAFEKNILVDIKAGAGKFTDHRKQASNKKQYKIQYFENFTAGGTQDASGMYIASQYDEEDKIYADGTLFKHDGWRILGWATKAVKESNEEKHENKISYSIGTFIGGRTDGNAYDHKAWGDDDTEPLILYAVWDRSIYTVKFHPNVNKYSGSMADQMFSYAVEQSLNPNQYKVTGKRFTGWKDKNGTDYKGDYSESTMTLTNEATVDLFAQWVDCTHKDGEHPGTLSYTIVDGSTIVETCDCEGHKASIGLVGPNGTIYHDGNAHPAIITHPEGMLLADVPTISYKFCVAENGTYTNMPEGEEPTNEGFYEASITVKDKTISVRYQILSASSTVSVDAECIDGQQFGPFNGSSSCSIEKDDAFTVLYSIQNLDKTYYLTEPSLVMSQEIPEGTTVIMQVNNSYWYKNIEKGTAKISMNEFSKMGENVKFTYNPDLTTQEYRFVFDFSKVAELKQLSGTLEAELIYKHKSSDNDSAKKSVVITLNDKDTFSLSGTAESLQITAPQDKSFSRWNKKNLVLVVTAKNRKQFPADAKLTVESGGKTYYYSKNVGDKFVIPIAWISQSTVKMYMNSDLLSAEKSYPADVKLCVGDEVKNSNDQPQAEEYETEAQVIDISLSVSDMTTPSLRIDGEQKVLKKTDTLNLTILMKGTDDCNIHATIQKKEASDYGGDFLSANVKSGANNFSLGGIQEAGSYRLLITVTKNNQEVLTVPYYFIVQ